MRQAFISSRCAYQPVVPTTMRPPRASTARMFSTAASGAVKSMTTSTPARLGAVSAEACAVLVDVERAHAVAALASDFGDESAGFSFAENEDEH